MKQSFIDAVNSGNLIKVRLSLSNELLLDPRGKTFAEMLNYAKNHLPNLFEPNKEMNLEVPPKNKWDEDFLLNIKNELDLNFSVEKLALYQVVVKEVGKEKASKMEADERKPIITHREPSQSRRRVIKPTSAALTTGGAVLTIIGICAGKTLLTVLGGTILVGGVLLMVNDNRK